MCLDAVWRIFSKHSISSYPYLYVQLKLSLSITFLLFYVRGHTLVSLGHRTPHWLRQEALGTEHSPAKLCHGWMEGFPEIQKAGNWISQREDTWNIQLVRNDSSWPMKTKRNECSLLEIFVWKCGFDKFAIYVSFALCFVDYINIFSFRECSKCFILMLFGRDGNSN